ncbi:hypothetical protein [Polymorphospora sp. NPDC050346]|uniref:hypothetical protein n=1 Tax=Polymorphospora sp. NPDC050346 TaxID=3155780 RepID=UPI0033C03DD8
MDPSLKTFLIGYFSPETAGRTRETRNSLRNSSPEYQARIKRGLDELLTSQELSLAEFLNLTDTGLGSLEEMYAALAAARAFLFCPHTSQSDQDR